MSARQPNHHLHPTQKRNQRTSRNLPHPALGNNKPIPRHLHRYLAVMHKEQKLEPARILGALVPAGRQLDDPGAKKGHREGFCKAEVWVFRCGAGLYFAGGEGEFWVLFWSERGLRQRYR